MLLHFGIVISEDIKELIIARGTVCNPNKRPLECFIKRSLSVILSV